MPYRGIFLNFYARNSLSCPRAEWQDANGYWHEFETEPLIIKRDAESVDGA